jgi:ribonuclease VapC
LIAIDSSAIVAILAGDPEAAPFRARIEAVPDRFLSAFNLFETRTILQKRYGRQMVSYLGGLLDRLEIAIMPFDEVNATIAFTAYRKYGRGTGHKAQLTLGDCAAYALAISLDLPLLFKGDEFRHTDVKPALG